MRARVASAALLAIALLTGCSSNMLDSQRLPTGLEEIGATCHSNAGAYHLPRRLVMVQVRTGAAAGYAIQVNQGDPKYVADRNETYCLDFLLSPTSIDRVGVQRDTMGLLQRVYTQAEDKSKEIVQTSVQAIADLVSSQQADSLRSAYADQIVDAGTAVIASFEFDPFVEREAREVNIALAEFGYCLFLDPTNDPFVPAWSLQICKELADQKTPRQARKPPSRNQAPVWKAEPYLRSGLRIFDPKPVSKEWQSRGILYRPDLSHSLVVLRQKDPGSRQSPWMPAASERVNMPNAAPAFVLEVKRATFVTAKTDVVFTNGMIKSISVDKPSELLAVSHLAVAVAQTIVQIPQRTFDIFSNRAQNTEALIRANAELIDALRQYGTDVDAAAAVRQDLIVPRSSVLRADTRVPNTIANTASARLFECLRNPAVQRHKDPAQFCRNQTIQGP